MHLPKVRQVQKVGRSRGGLSIPLMCPFPIDKFFYEPAHELIRGIEPCTILRKKTRKTIQGRKPCMNS